MLQLGDFIAYQDLGGGVQGPQMFNLKITGTGTMTLDSFATGNGSYVIDSASVQFNGTATVVPEPSSLTLLGSGLVGLAGLIKMRLRPVES